MFKRLLFNYYVLTFSFIFQLILLWGKTSFFDLASEIHVVNSNQEISKEPLWAIPVPIQERLQSRLKDREYSHFQMCGLYSAVAITFLLMFGFSALSRGELTYALVILGFACVTIIVYASAWYSKNYSYTKHFLTLLMGLLCLYLYYTGGTANTGPLYFFVFPLVAFFLQGHSWGLMSVVVLLLLTMILEMGAFGFDVDRYSDLFFIRIASIYMIISLLSFMFEFFRVKAERELLLSVYDLNQLTFGDMTTNLANRRLMEKLLVSEVNLANRYPIDCCVMIIEADNERDLLQNNLDLVRLRLSLILRKHLRLQDIPGCWDETRFLVLLPETTMQGAMILANRLQTECKQQSLNIPGLSVTKLSVSIGVSALEPQTPDELMQKLTGLLQQARMDGGGRIAIASE